MTETFKVGDLVGWNSEAGRVSGRIAKVHTKDVNYKGYIHHASKDDPQYEIKAVAIRGTARRRAPLTVCNPGSLSFAPTAEDRDADRETVHAPHS
jgi:hypothetical protein